MKWVLSYDDRTDGGPMHVGPFDTREDAENYFSENPGRESYAGCTILPLSDPDQSRGTERDASVGVVPGGES